MITEIIFPENISSIGEAAFANNSISKIIFTKNIQGIGYKAFMNNQLNDIDLPDGKLTSIGVKAFAANNGLQSFRLPKHINDSWIWETSEEIQIEGGVITTNFQTLYSVEYRKN